MTVIYDINERRVIPNWRDFRRTLLLGELNNPRKKKHPSFDINRTIQNWRKEKNVGTAADLINSIFVSDSTNVEDFIDVNNFLKSHSSSLSQTLNDLIALINNQNNIQSTHSGNILLEKDITSTNELEALINNHAFYRILHRTKKKVRSEIYNPITWVELARFYSIMGQFHKANKSILTALHLDPDNRFILRSATRYFIHTQQFDKALYYLRKSISTKYDPWLISAHIATSNIIDRFSPLIKDGINIVNSKNHSHFDITELSSSIGTLELKNGSYKKAKKFINISLLSPNDNSLAQAEWISYIDNRFAHNLDNFNNVTNKFEANALDYYNEGKWELSFFYTLKWLLDLPYSKRPALLGSYISSILLNDKKSAIAVCEIGLQANPNDTGLLNNLVYSLATQEHINKSKLEYYLEKLSSINLSSLPDRKKITIQATLGLVAFKNNYFDKGISLYNQAIEYAKKTNHKSLMNLAIINLTRELILLNHPDSKKYINYIKSLKFDADQKDIEFIRQEVIKSTTNSTS